MGRPTISRLSALTARADVRPVRDVLEFIGALAIMAAGMGLVLWGLPILAAGFGLDVVPG